MHRFVPYPDDHRVLFELDGDFGHDPAQAFVEFKNAAQLVRCREGSFDLLADFSRVRRIPDEHVRYGLLMTKWSIENGLKRCASVLVSAGQRMAVLNFTAGDPRFDYFLNRGDAERWLGCRRLRNPLFTPLASSS